MYRNWRESQPIDWGEYAENMGNFLGFWEGKAMKIDGPGQGCAYSISKFLFPYLASRFISTSPKDRGDLVAAREPPTRFSAE
jgi:hypothetical protein